MKEKIKSAANEAYRELQKLAGGGIAGLKNCQYIALIAANLVLINELADKIEEKTEDSDGSEHSDDLCEPE